MDSIKVTIDLNKPFIGLDGQPFRDQTGSDLKNANFIVANFVYNTFSPDKSDKLRNRAWAQELFAKGKLEIDKRGIDAILEICVQARMLDGIYCQLQDWMDEAKEEWDRLKEEAKSVKKSTE